MSIGLLVAVMVVYFGFMILISVMGRKKATNFDNYLDAGRTAGILLIIGSQVGSHIGNGVVVGGAAEGAAVGIGGMTYGLACAFSCFVIAFVLAPWLRKHDFRSTPEFYLARYGKSRMLTIIYVAGLTFTNIGLIGGQLVAGRALFEALGLNGTLGIFVIAIVVMIYSQISGMWGAMATSVAQTGIIIAALVAAFVYIFLGQGGFEVIRSAADAGTYPAAHLDFTTAYTLPAVLMMFIPPAISGIGDIANFQRVNSAKSTKTIIVGQCISGVLVAIAAALPVLIGMYAKAALGSEGTSTFFDVIGHVFPPLLAAIVFTAVIAAIMSTIDCLFISGAQMFLNDIYKEMINPNVEDKTLRKWTLPLNIAMVAVSIIIALGADSILDLLSSTLVFVTASCLVPFMGGVVWKKATKEGAVSSALVGLIFACLEFFGIFTLPYSGITVYLPGLIVFIVVSLATQKKQTADA